MSGYSIDDGDGNQIAEGASDHEVWQTARRMADERGRPVYVWTAGVGVTEVEPSVRISAGSARPSARADGATDVDVTLTIGLVAVEGEVTLVPSEHGLSSWGAPDNWVSRDLLKVIVDAASIAAAEVAS